jgi:hypoxanthine-DNA glycosylase
MASKIKSNLSFTMETHPNWYRDVPAMETLILGSFPPHYSKWTYEFYYPNKQNRFWKILASLCNFQLHEYPKMDNRYVEERYAIMQELKIGIQNIGFKAKREGNSSLDTKIEIVTYHNILHLIKTHPKVNKILLPGFAAKSSTYRCFLQYLNSCGIHLTPVKKPQPIKTNFLLPIDNRNIKCIVLNSTSTASTVPYEDVFLQFKRAIFDT